MPPIILEQAGPPAAGSPGRPAVGRPGLGGGMPPCQGLLLSWPDGGTAHHADTDRRAHSHSSRRQQAQADRRVHRPRQFRRPRVSVAHMRSPRMGGAGQTPEFDEFTMVLKGLSASSTREGAWMSGRASGDHPRRRVGALLHAGGGRRGVHRSVPAGVLAGDGAPRLVAQSGL